MRRIAALDGCKGHFLPEAAVEMDWQAMITSDIITYVNIELDCCCKDAPALSIDYIR
jgi:hypothetical protein